MPTNNDDLNTWLKPEHRQAGFYLEENEDFIYLKRKGEILGVWNSAAATAQFIQDRLDALIKEDKSDKNNK